MSLKLVFATAVLAALFSSGSAMAYDRHFDFGQVWGDAQSEHQRDEALSATPRDAMRRYPSAVYGGGRPHDPTGNIILERSK